MSDTAPALRAERTDVAKQQLLAVKDIVDVDADRPEVQALEERAVIGADRIDVVIADEPTGNLDAESGREVLTLLDQLIRKGRMTTLMVTHSAEVARLADRVITIKDGGLVETAASTEA